MGCRHPRWALNPKHAGSTPASCSFRPRVPEPGSGRTEVETEVVSAVRALESRLARRRCELRSRVPHEDAVSVARKLAQRLEQRFDHRGSWVRLPCLLQPLKWALERTRGFGPASRCPGGGALGWVTRNGPRDTQKVTQWTRKARKYCLMHILHRQVRCEEASASRGKADMTRTGSHFRV